MPEWIRKLFFIAFLVLIIVGSFWVSFLIGKQMLLPTKQLPSKLIQPEVDLPQPKPALSDITIEVETGAPLSSESQKIAIQKVDEVKPATPPIKEAPVKKPVKQTAAAAGGNYCVQVGVFKYYDNAKIQVTTLKKKGFASSIMKQGEFWRVSAGSFNSPAGAKNLTALLKASGFDAVVRRK